MPITSFPNGLSSFGVPLIGGGSSSNPIPLTFGNIWYVSSVVGNTAYNGSDPSTPMATVMQAHAKATAANGDVIVLLPRHSETITSAGAITISKSGVQVVGTGLGGARSKITLGTAATATILISAANCGFKNVSFESAIDDCATVFVVEGTDFTVDGCSFKQSAVNKNFFSLVKVGVSTTANVADGFTWINNYRHEIDAAALADISILANTDNVLIANNFSNTSSAADVGHFLIMAALVTLGLRVLNNIMILNGDNNAQSVGDFITGSSTTSTGVVGGNWVASLDTTGELLDTATLDFGHFENYHSGTIAKSGTILPAIE